MALCDILLRIALREVYVPLWSSYLDKRIGPLEAFQAGDEDVPF